MADDFAWRPSPPDDIGYCVVYTHSEGYTAPNLEVMTVADAIKRAWALGPAYYLNLPALPPMPPKREG